jgi:hypothetical protein
MCADSTGKKHSKGIGAHFDLKAYARQGAAARVADLNAEPHTEPLCRHPGRQSPLVKGERVKALYIPLPQ